MSWAEKFTIPGECLMSNNCRLQTSLSQSLDCMGIKEGL